MHGNRVTVFRETKQQWITLVACAAALVNQNAQTEHKRGLGEQWPMGYINEEGVQNLATMTKRATHNRTGRAQHKRLKWNKRGPLHQNCCAASLFLSFSVPPSYTHMHTNFIAFCLWVSLRDHMPVHVGLMLSYTRKCQSSAFSDWFRINSIPQSCVSLYTLWVSAWLSRIQPCCFVFSFSFFLRQ